MSLDEKIFGAIFQAFKKTWRKAPQQELDTACFFAACEKRLQIFTWAIFEEPIVVLPAETEEGLYGARLYLPKAFSWFKTPDENYQLYLWRILAAATARRCGFVLTIDQSRDKNRHRNASIIAIPYLLQDMFSQFSATTALWRKLHDALGMEDPGGVENFRSLASFGEIWELSLTQPVKGPQAFLMDLWGLLPVEAARSDKPQKLEPEALESKKSQSTPSSIRTSVNPKKAILRPEQENPVSHVFEKVLTAEDYQGGNKPQDGDRGNELGNATQDLLLTHVIRTNQTADTFAKVDPALDGVGMELEAKDGEATIKNFFLYPEWHHKSRQYKRNWCRIVEEPFVLASPINYVEEDAERIAKRQLRQRLERLVNRNDWVRRQLDGDDLDLNAVVERHSDLLAGAAASDRVHLAKHPLKWDVATLILLDISQSTDGWIGGHRVFDVLKSSVRILAGAFTGLGEQTALCGFSSYTRNQCRFLVLKDFTDPWAQAVTTLNAIEPQGYSRIGPAIRHALHKLAAVKAQKKQLLVLSDMKPTDYDFYEGQHGLHDVRKALVEARGLDIHFHALTFAASRLSLHEKMLGNGNFSYVTEPGQIADKVFQIYLKSFKSRRRY